ncbi:MAG: type II toxin-antitoxin system HicB family antitoxin [Candidatus Omnitrophica bacterium]|nr:type II toxin-antitoxin system HicB family antitoxin [Candidatus Omnitrophota bacterium]
MPTTQIVIRAEIFREGRQYVALCPELNVSSFGDSIDEARRSLQEAVSLFLEECVRLGSLHHVLEEAGFSQTKTTVPQWLPPQPIEIEPLAIPLRHG